MLDVAFGEDASSVRQGNAAENLSGLRRMALNMLKRETTSRGGRTDFGGTQRGGQTTRLQDVSTDEENGYAVRRYGGYIRIKVDSGEFDSFG